MVKAARTSIAQKLWLALVANLLAMIAFGVMALYLATSVEAQREELNANHTILETLGDLEARMIDCETASRGFVITGQEDYLEPYLVARPDAERALRTLTDLLAADQEGLKLLVRLDELARNKWVVCDRNIQIRKEQGPGPALEAVRSGAGKRSMDEFRRTMSQMRESQVRALRRSEILINEKVRLAIVLLGIGNLCALGAMIAAGVAISRHVSRALRQLIESAERLGEGQLDARVDTSADDEFGTLARAFNAMAAKVGQATEQRQKAESQLAAQVEALTARNHEIQELSAMAELLQNATGLDESYQVLRVYGGCLFPSGAGTVYLLNASRNELEPVSSWGNQPAPPPIAPGDCWGLKLGRPHRVEGPESIPCAHATGGGQSGCFPLQAHGDILGLLVLRHPSQESPLPMKLGEALAENISLALANLQLRERLRLQSIRDPLTGLFNRRFMEESLERELHRARRSGGSLAVAMVDIDHFKKFNDAYGHEAGDVVLVELGQFLKSNIRAGDVACRFGGEEFCLLLPDASLEQAVERAEHIRRELVHLRPGYAGQSLGPITLSIGVAAFPTSARDGQELIRQADLALYRAKESGRDRVDAARSPHLPEGKSSESRES